MLHFSTLCAGAAASLLPIAASAQVSLTLVPSPGTAGIKVHGVSADGSTVVGFTYYSQGTAAPGEQVRSWRWRPATSFAYLGYESTTLNLVATTATGSECVYTYFSSLGARPTRWTGPGAVAILPQYQPGAESIASGVSGDGSVIVGWSGSLACWWQANSFGAAMPNIPGGTYSRAIATNADGTVIVGWGSGPEHEQGIKWLKNGATTTVQGLPLLNPSFSSHALAVSANGAVTVGYGRISGADRACKWTDAGGVQMLEPFRTFFPQDCVALCVNGDGTVIGGLVRANNWGVSRAAIWLEDGRLIDLTDYLSEHGANLQGARLLNVKAISADGQTIVGETSDGPSSAGMYIARLQITPPCGRADVGRQGGEAGIDGLLDNNDFIVYINRFFANDLRADLGTQGGLPGFDGGLDNNDLIAFIDEFFEGC